MGAELLEKGWVKSKGTEEETQVRTMGGRPQATEVLWEFGSLENAERWCRKEDTLPGLPFKSIPCLSLPWAWEMLGEGIFVPAR